MVTIMRPTRMPLRSRVVFTVVCGLLGLGAGGGQAQGAQGTEQARQGQPAVLSWGADARAGYFGSRTQGRNGVQEPWRDVFAMRVRVGTEARMASGLTARARIAGRFGTGQRGVEWYLRNHAPSTGGLAPGQVSLDELHLEYRPSGLWRVRLGRMQTRADRMGLLGKSLDRKDSGNTRVTWTDGAHLTYGTAGGWNADVIVQRNAGEGPSNVARPPLRYTDPDNRLTVFAAIGSRDPRGALVQRGLAITYTPDVLHGDGAGGAKDYLAVVGRAALQWDLGGAQRRLVLAGEAGYAPQTPTRAEMAVGGEGHVSGLAGHVSTTVYDLAPGHHVGVVYGRAEPGWLISPDYRNNGHLVEGRYQWKVTAAHSIETRLRWRRDIHELSGAERPREDLDLYVRLTTSF
jgi:hypothetical protein